MRPEASESELELHQQRQGGPYPGPKEVESSLARGRLRMAYSRNRHAATDPYTEA